MLLKSPLRPNIVPMLLFIASAPQWLFPLETRVLVVLFTRKHLIYPHRVNDLAISGALVSIGSSRPNYPNNFPFFFRPSR